MSKNLDGIIAKYEKNKEEFQWFIEKYFGIDMVKKLDILAEEKNQLLLFNILNDIWFELPDHIFNIMENPKGWKEFLEVIEV